MKAKKQIGDRVTVIRSLEHNGEYYEHWLDLDDDSVSVFDGDRYVIVYDSKCTAWVDGKVYGRFSIRDDHWVFTNEQTGEVIVGKSANLAEGLLDFEVEISKKYLDGIAINES